MTRLRSRDVDGWEAEKDVRPTEAPLMRTEQRKTLPKTAAVCAQWVRCSRSRCRCARGELHGPYVVRYWYEAGRRRKAYVPRDRVPAVAAGLVHWQELHPPVWSMRQLLAELRRIEEEVLR